MKKTGNPLIKRIPRELLGDWRKYLVVGLFLILTIGFVSGMYVANGSMMQAAEEGVSKYKLEDGHFELNKKADEALLSAVAGGEKADVHQYILDKAEKEFDEKFDDEYAKEFKDKFEEEFPEKFEESYEEQALQAMTAQGLDENTARGMLPTVLQTAKDDGSFRKAYDNAYEDAYKEAYEENYQTAREEAWEEVLTEVEDKYEEAVEKYELNEDDAAVPVTVYANFFRNETEGSEGTIRVFPKTEEINLACVLDGRLPEKAEEIAVDRMHASNAGIQNGDTIKVGGQEYQVVGLIAYVNYSTLHEKNSDMMFDALKFDVAMVTDEGFERLSSPIHYNYAWKYESAPADKNEEKQLSDRFMKALLTQAVTSDREIENYIPRYANAAVNFATDDMGKDMAMGGVLLYVLIGIIAFIFAITCTNTISREASAIGTLRASGYTRGELTAHYLAMPVIVTLVSAVIGNILGYTVFKNTVMSMYYNSYSLPTYQTIWNGTAFLRTTLLPVILMFVINLAVIAHMMHLSPLKFLRHDLKRRKQKKAMRLPRWRFFARFRLRIIFQNLPNYLILFVGVLFVAIMLAMAVGMPATLKHYQDNAADMMFADYQYVLKSSEDDDGNVIETQAADAEIFDLRTLLRKDPAFEEEISVYGVVENSRYIELPKYEELEKSEVYISSSYADKYSVGVGDSIILGEQYENKEYTFRVAGIYDKGLSLAVFLPIEHYTDVFETDEKEFTGYLSDTEITDIEEKSIATVITQREITKMADQLDHSMGAYMTYFQYLCILLSAVLIYLLTKIIVEKNETAISMIKILGFEDKEIFRLYLLSTTIVVVIADAVSAVIGALVMTELWKMILAQMSGYFAFMIAPIDYLKIFLFIFLGYLIVLVFDFRRIRKIPLDEALKNVE
ncbi:MAG: ABC transporter permease [Eubacteriales bacterium]|nr:ABC transporter permease [Eubacteriales bacterium]